MASPLTSQYSLDPILQSKLYVDNLRTSQIDDPIV